LIRKVRCLRDKITSFFSRDRLGKYQKWGISF